MIWLALALVAEIPPVVRLFFLLQLNDIQLTISQVFLILNLNGA